MSIHIEKLNYVYQSQTPFAHRALTDVSLDIADGTYTAIIGHTGSGKSTLLQHLNGLLKPTSGKLSVADNLITPDTKNKDLNELRHHVGFVFQFPEAQLFEETVLKDIAFAPKNFGKTENEANQIATKMAALVGLPKEVLNSSPFELSGGQMRRVAIAGVLAMEPQILVLDEPTAGLDPKGRLEMMQMFQRLHEEQGLTIILVTHQMNDVANYAGHVIVMEKGRIIADDSPTKIFSDPSWLVRHHLGLPQTTEFAAKLADRGVHFDQLPLTEGQLARKLVSLMPKKSGGEQHG